MCVYAWMYVCLCIDVFMYACMPTSMGEAAKTLGSSKPTCLAIRLKSSLYRAPAMHSPHSTCS